MYRVYIGIFFAIVFASSVNACWVSDRKGEAPGYCPATVFRHEHLDGFCYIICDTCAWMLKYEIAIEGHAHLCPQRGGSCPVGTANCSGTTSTIDHPSSDIFPCIRTCPECQQSSQNENEHFPECMYHDSPGDLDNPDGGGGDDNGGNGGAGDDSGSGGDDLNVPSPDAFVPGKIELPSLEKEDLIKYNGLSPNGLSFLNYFSFLDQNISQKAPSFSVPLGLTEVVVDFSEPTLLGAIFYVRAFEIACITIASFYYVIYLLRSFEK